MRATYSLIGLFFIVLSVSAQPSSTGINGQTYTNAELKFQITFPDYWQIKSSGLGEKAADIGLEAPETIDRASRVQINRSLERVRVLLTAQRLPEGASDPAFIQILAEDLSLNPQIKDAVDYFDAIRSQYLVMRLPGDFKYSETDAEKLGKMQFAFLDTETSAGKKRMYATVRRGVAIVFTLSYSKPHDLKDFRDILAKGDLNLP
ncbi:hypothetical protein [Leptolyngbya sp. 7M]|uniref:hypothetical protein n=1 Tax=Leptolyngbya sp. 7M TaxID=2812896 RepID=UPI001B8C4DFB|nr:hypothetical protein [Leptolyngbya sp. 7M]QYO65510.1 hypothetical protein JVX88_01610 [Leptolyngbya sp. 7M]